VKAQSLKALRCCVVHCIVVVVMVESRVGKILGRFAIALQVVNERSSSRHKSHLDTRGNRPVMDKYINVMLCNTDDTIALESKEHE
jgi:hypothetical protein